MIIHFKFITGRAPISLYSNGLQQRSIIYNTHNQQTNKPMTNDDHILSRGETKATLYAIPFDANCRVSSNDASTTAVAASVCFTPEKGYILQEDDMPHLAIVLDSSGSMQGQKTENAQAAIRELCRLCSEKQDEYPIRISITAFDDNATIAMPPTPGPTPHDVEIALRSMHARGGTDFAIGLQTAMSVISNDEPTVVVLFTDGQDCGKMRNGDNTVLEIMRTHARLLVHTVAIGHDADNDYLRRIANSMRCTGESVQVSATGIPSVMAAIHASVVQSAIGPSAVEMHAIGPSSVERYSMPVVIQIAEGVDGNPMPIEAGFIVPIGTTSVRFALRFRDADVVVTDTIAIGNANVDVDKAAQAASKFFVPYIAAAAAKALKSDDADTALMQITHAMQTIRVMSELPAAHGARITSELDEIRRRVQALGIQLRATSDASTRTNTLAAIENLAAGALETIRASSGAMPLVETEARSMSGMARTQSDAAYAVAVEEDYDEAMLMRS